MWVSSCSAIDMPGQNYDMSLSACGGPSVSCRNATLMMIAVLAPVTIDRKRVKVRVVSNKPDNCTCGRAVGRWL